MSWPFSTKPDRQTPQSNSATPASPSTGPLLWALLWILHISMELEVEGVTLSAGTLLLCSSSLCCRKIKRKSAFAIKGCSFPAKLFRVMTALPLLISLRSTAACLLWHTGQDERTPANTTPIHLFLSKDNIWQEVMQQELFVKLDWDSCLCRLALNRIINVIRCIKNGLQQRCGGKHLHFCQNTAKVIVTESRKGITARYWCSSANL